MSQKRGKKIAFKGVLAICLLVNNFSSFSAVVKATTVDTENIINSDISENLTNSDEGLLETEESQESLSSEGDNPIDGEMPSYEETIQPEDVLPDEVPVDEEADDSKEILNEGALLSIESRSSGSGLVQLWQVVPDGQQSKEGKTTAEIMKALQCRPNHNLYPSGGRSEHNTYVNSCYVDDALYLGEEANYYKIYLSGYEGKVPKSESHWFELDLNNDGVKVKYEIKTVAYYISGETTMYSLQETTEPLAVPELNYYDQYLDKYNDINESNERGITTLSNSMVQSPSYYANEGGTLIHYLTKNVTKANGYSKVTVGKAPSWMNSGVKYYSYDGIYFYTNWRNIKVNGQGAVNQSNPFYNYYQYLPFRSKSNYYISTFDNYTNSNGGADGKLLNAGKYFYAVQDNYGINGALQYAMGIHESGWGKSSLSIDKNNLFGMNATDNNPYGNGTSFPSVESGINYHADRYLSWGYTDPIDDFRYFGSHVGNKGSGMNVKYASDPFWGEKIAGWYYRFDNASGLKDYNYYTIGIKQSNAIIDIKSQANSSSTNLYQTKNGKSNLRISNYPFLIIDKKLDYFVVKTDTPIYNGKPKFNSKYEWYNTNAYIDENTVSHLNHENFKAPGYSDISKYIGFVDTISNGQTINHYLEISGWYINSLGIKDLYLVVDGRIYDKINNRYDLEWVSSMYPDYNTENAGFNYTLNTNGLSEGEHTISVQAMGVDGSINELTNSKVYVSNYRGWIDTPINQSEVNGIVDINGWYINSLGIKDLYLVVDGRIYDKINNRYDLGWVSSMYPGYNTENAGFNYTLNTNGLSEGEHTISVQAMGADGSINQLGLVTIYVTNDLSEYSGWIDTPINQSEVNGIVDINGWYINSLGIKDLYLVVDGRIYDKINNRYDLGWVSSMYPDYNTENAGFNYTLNTNGLSEGEHTISVQAMGADGSINQLGLVTIYVTNNLSEYSGWIDTPINQSEVNGIVDINGWYINSLGIKDLYLVVDGRIYDKINNRYDLGWVSSMYPDYNTENAGFNYTLNTNGLSEGEHTISVQAMGVDEGMAWLPSVTIYVNRF